MKRLLLLLLLFPLAGCVTTDGPGSVSGTCSVFTPPTYAVRGATQYDQDWIDPTIEGGVGACHWPRPAARPAALDAPHVAPHHAAAPKKKRPGLVARVKAKVWPTAAVAPVEAVPEPEPAPVAPPAAPRSAIDELLNPSERP